MGLIRSDGVPVSEREFCFPKICYFNAGQVQLQIQGLWQTCQYDFEEQTYTFQGESGEEVYATFICPPLWHACPEMADPPANLTMSEEQGPDATHEVLIGEISAATSTEPPNLPEGEDEVTLPPDDPIDSPTTTTNDDNDASAASHWTCIAHTPILISYFILFNILAFQ